MKNAMLRLKNNFNATRESESGDIVQTILIIVVFVAIVVAVGSLLWSAIDTRAKDAASCIENANPVTGSDEGC